MASAASACRWPPRRGRATVLLLAAVRAHSSTAHEDRKGAGNEKVAAVKPRPQLAGFVVLDCQSRWELAEVTGVTPARLNSRRRATGGPRGAPSLRITP